MFVTKILEKKGVIQTFGVALILAPFANTLTKLYILSADSSQRTWNLYWYYFTNKSSFLQLLAVMTILNGILMLRGRSSAWRFSLAVLGGYIVHQIMNFGADFRQSGVAAVYLGINILAFAFIVDQLVWKVEAKKPVAKPQPKPQPKVEPTPAPQPVEAKPMLVIAKVEPEVAPVRPTPKAPASAPASIPVAVKAESAKVTPIKRIKSLKSTRKILLALDSNEPWAQVTAITSQGFMVKCLLPEAPQGIENREVEFHLKGGPLLRARLSDSKGKEYIFKYIDPSAGEISQLNHWLQKIAS